MRYSILTGPIALVASVSAAEYATTSVEVVSTLTTYCSSATSLSINGKIHTVTEATTLTITECPCTITHSLVASSSTPLAVSSAPVAPIVTPVLSSAPVVRATSSIPSPIQAATSSPVAPVVVATSSTPAVILSTAPAAPLSSAIPPVAPYPVSNSTTLVPIFGTASAAGTGSPSSVPSASLGSATPITTPAAKTPFKGAGNRVAASGVSLVALFGLAVFFL